MTTTISIYKGGSVGWTTYSVRYNPVSTAVSYAIRGSITPPTPARAGMTDSLRRHNFAMFETEVMARAAHALGVSPNMLVGRPRDAYSATAEALNVLRNRSRALLQSNRKTDA